MPVKITVAMSKVTGPPECESLDATCTLFDEDSSVLQDPETFQRAVRTVIVACHEALDPVRQP